MWEGSPTPTGPPQTPWRWGEGCFPPSVPRGVKGKAGLTPPDPIPATRPHPQASWLPLPAAGNARNSQSWEDRSSWLNQHTGAGVGGGGAPSSRDGHHATGRLRNPSISQSGNCPPQQEREASQTAGEDEISPQAASGAACNKTSCAMAVPTTFAPGQCPTEGDFAPQRAHEWQDDGGDKCCPPSPAEGQRPFSLCQGHRQSQGRDPPEQAWGAGCIYFRRA